jgi:hypothetical protein
VILREQQHADDPVVVFHEKIHIRQQAELLVGLFFVWYFLEFLIRFAKHRNKDEAYHNISFEREAYANEKSPDYLKSRPFWKFFRYL